MSWENILKAEFPKEITHDEIKYYVVEYIDDRSGEIGVYHTDDDKAPDQVLHLYLDEAKEKMQ